MNWYYNLKISRKLLLGFILVAFIAGLVGYEGISSLKTMDDNSTILYETNVVPLSAMIDLTTAFQRMRANGLELLTASTKEEHDAAIKNIEARRKDVDVNIEEIKKSVNVQVMPKIDAFANADNNFDQIFTRFINLCLAEKDAEAGVLWKTELNNARIQEQNALADLDNTLTDRGKARAEKNNAAADSATNLMIIFVVIGVLVAIGLGYFISKNIKKILDIGLILRNPFLGYCRLNR